MPYKTIQLDTGTANTLKFDTNTLVIDESNNRIGIGTASPWSNLSISSGGLSAVGDEDNPAFSLGKSDYRFGMYTTAEGAVLQNKNGDDGFQFKVKTAGDAVRIDGVSGNVGIGTTSPSKILDITSTTSGFLPPRMTTTQRDAISSPIAGEIIYNTTTNVLNFYDGSASAWGAV
tara:strand:+ start:663 stop:1184 length:522 start_codon:yes stop_codon:yes gene_type:complete